MVLVPVLAAVSRVSAAAVSPADCAALRRHGHRTESQACYQSLTLSTDPYLRAEGDWGLELYQDANNEFRNAVARADGIAQAPDGSLYISDSQKGKIWRVMYTGK